MKKHLKKLQSKPDAHRKKLATLFAVITTLGVIVLWLVVQSIVTTPRDVRPSITVDPEIENQLESLFERGSVELENIQEAAQFRDLERIEESLEQESQQSFVPVPDTNPTPLEEVSN